MQLLGIVAFVAYPFMRLQFEVIREWPMLHGGTYVLLALPFFIWQFRTKRLVRRERGRLCGNCLFPLEGLPSEGDCPECGQTYSIEDTVARWRRDLQIEPEKE